MVFGAGTVVVLIAAAVSGRPVLTASKATAQAPARAERVTPVSLELVRQEDRRARVQSLRPDEVLPAAIDEDEYTQVEIRGKLEKPESGKDWSLASQNRLWKLELGRDRLLLFVAPQLQGKTVLVTGKLRITEGKLDTVRVTRIEPVELPRTRD